MKKILPVALVLALVLALMIVPAFADTVYSATLDEDGYLIMDALPPVGDYHLTYSGGYGELGSYEGIVSLTARSNGDLIADLHTDSPAYSSFTLIIDPSTLQVIIMYSSPEGDGDVYPDSFILTPVSPAPVDPESPVEAVLGVFSGIGSWIVSSLIQFTGLFYSAESGLTLLGVLCCLPIAIGICFVVLLLIINFFKLRN